MKQRRSNRASVVAMLLAAGFLAAGCGPKEYRRQADNVAYGLIRRAQAEALGKTEPFTIERPADTLRRRLAKAQMLPYTSPASIGTDKLAPIAHWPEKDYPKPAPGLSEPLAPVPADGTLCLTLLEALQVAARNSREFQSRKEDVFAAALELDLEQDEFRNTFAGLVDELYSSDLSGPGVEGGLESTGELSWTRKLKTGAVLTSRIVVDLVQLLTMDRASTLGILADATVSIPLLRGSGRHIVTEPLTQAERDLIYAIYTFERFKRILAVRVASEYLAVLNQLDRVQNEEENYRSLLISTRRARRLADAGRLPEIQVDQTKQDELRARERWIVAQQLYARRLDTFKITLGLPTDASIDLDRGELARLAAAAKVTVTVPATMPASSPSERPAAAPPADAPVELAPPDRADAGPLELDPHVGIEIGLDNRLDLRTAVGQVYDAQRRVVVAADRLGAELTLSGSATWGERRSLGSAGSPNAQLRPERGLYAAGLVLDLPLERTAEQNFYRDSWISLERSVRSLQDLEDQIKLNVREALRTLLQARESIKIQAQAVELARRRVASTELFLQAGRAQIRDVLESQEALISAQNALTASLVNYRIAELELQRDMGVLEVNEKGLWREFDPQKIQQN